MQVNRTNGLATLSESGITYGNTIQTRARVIEWGKDSFSSKVPTKIVVESLNLTGTVKARTTYTLKSTGRVDDKLADVLMRMKPSALELKP